MRVLIVALLCALSYAQTANSVDGILGVSIPQTKLKQRMPTSRGYANSGASPYVYNEEYMDMYEDRREDQYKARQYAQYGGKPGGDAVEMEDMYKYGGAASAASSRSTGVLPTYFYQDTAKQSLYNPEIGDMIEEVMEDIWKRDPTLYNQIITQMSANPQVVNQITTNPNSMSFATNNVDISQIVQRYPSLYDVLEDFPSLYSIGSNFGAFYNQAMLDPDVAKDVMKYKNRVPEREVAGYQTEFPRYAGVYNSVGSGTSYRPGYNLQHRHMLQKPRANYPGHQHPQLYGLPQQYGERRRYNF